MQQNDGRSTLYKLGDNFIALMVLQGVNYLVPLIVFPYLVRVLGIDGFGLYNFIFYVIWMGVVISDYGFDLTATKLVSIHREDKKKLHEIFSAVMQIKLLLAFAFLLFLTLLILLFDKFAKDALLYYLAFGFVIGQALFPVWFFQGIERMRYITLLNGISKLIFTLLIFVFVHSKADLDLVFLFNALGSIIAGVLALIIATKQFGVKFIPQSYEVLRFYLIDGWYVFLSRIAVEMYTSLNIVILGLFVNDTTLGYFSIVEKIIRALGNILEPLTRAAYPYLAKLHQSSYKDFYRKNIQLSLLIALLMIPLTFGVYSYVQEILSLISGKEVTPLMLHMYHIMVWILVVYLYGSQFTNMLVILEKTKILNIIVVIALILNVTLGLGALWFDGVIGFTYIYLFIALFISTIKGYFVYFKYKEQV